MEKCVKALTKGGRIRNYEKKETLLTKLEEESNIALSLCKDSEQRDLVRIFFIKKLIFANDQLMFEYMDFFVSMLQKYQKYNMRELEAISEKVLNNLMEVIPGSKLVQKFNEATYKLMENQYLVSTTVNHFKGLNSIITTTKFVNSASIYDKDEEFHDKILQGRGYYLELEQKTTGQSSMVFQSCEHSYKVRTNSVNSQQVYCRDCEQEQEKIECKFERFNLVQLRTV